MNARLFAFTAALLLFAATSWAEDNFNAQTFVASKCSGCHGANIYTRPNRRVQSLVQLKKQVKMCDQMVGTALFPEDLDAVVAHLNQQYYKF